MFDVMGMVNVFGFEINLESTFKVLHRLRHSHVKA